MLNANRMQLEGDRWKGTKGEEKKERVFAN
jgi:hypothetical protein